MEGKLPQPYPESYEEHWAYTSFKGKTILDLGADWGSTAEWFLMKGARRVTAVEGNPNYYQQLRENFKEDPRVETVHRWIDSPEDLQELLVKYPTEIVKVDIEGAEVHIANTPPNLVGGPKEWLIEYHTPEIGEALRGLFERLGFRTSEHHPRIPGVLGVLHTVKEEERQKGGEKEDEH